MIEKSQKEVRDVFGAPEALALHQLRLLEWISTSGRKRSTEEVRSERPGGVPEKWQLTKGVQQYAWQRECVNAWLANEGRGTVKVVTGGGKTLLALSVAEAVQNSLEPDLRVVIVVPTIVLMHQWFDAIVERGNLPSEAIGRLGGGYDEGFDGKRVLIAVLASATAQLPRLVKKANVGKRLMMIADECHRAGAKETSRVFKTERRWSLGLSATPEREDDVDSGYDQSLLGAALGPIIYEFNLADAVREGLVPKFVINHYGLPMTPEERSRYDALSRSITDAMSQLRAHRDSDGDFFAWARTVATRGNGDLSAVATRFISDTSRRRELLNRLQARHRAVEALIQQEFAVNADARVILFHESISEVTDLYLRLHALSLPVIMEHSDLPGSVREAGLELFRKGTARIIVSARSLIEGFDVPAVDVGIIVASSGSVRQRIQSLGRVLRRHRGRDGEEKTSCIHVLYAADSSEEHIYGKVDWNETTGVDRNRFFQWRDGEEPVMQAGPPRAPLPTEMMIDAETLVPGASYPGQYEGAELTCDSRGNICNSLGLYATDTAEIAQALLRFKEGGGKFRITPRRSFVLIRVPSDEDWETRFVMRLAQPLRFVEPSTSTTSLTEAVLWQKGARTGDPYPFDTLALSDGELRFKLKSGGLISKKVRGGEVFARAEERAEDPVKGADASRVIAALQKLRGSGKVVSRIDINTAGHVLFRENGRLFFVCALDSGLEFPAGEDNRASKS